MVSAFWSLLLIVCCLSSHDVYFPPCPCSSLPQYPAASRSIAKQVVLIFGDFHAQKCVKHSMFLLFLVFLHLFHTHLVRDFYIFPQDGGQMAQDGSKMAARWLKMGPRDDPRWLQMVRRWPQDGPKMMMIDVDGRKMMMMMVVMAARWLETAPRRAQARQEALARALAGHLRWLKDDPKTAQGGPKLGQAGPRWLQDGAKTAPRRPTWTQDGSQIAPRRPKTAKGGLKLPQDDHRMAPDRSKAGPSSPKNL